MSFSHKARIAFERFIHTQASSGLVLLFAACLALIWANSSFSDQYHAFWHTPISLGFGSFTFSQSLHFWINEALMTLFFLIVGMEVRNEIHSGSLSSLRSASLPIIAALGGVLVPALIFTSLNFSTAGQAGWAIPTATDIAFALGVLALLGKTVPHNLRVFLLALAIIDDVLAVLIIALFYSGGLDYQGFLIAGAGLALIFLWQKLGFHSAYSYLLPGAIVWFGLLKTGAHPTLAGVALGLLTPVHTPESRKKIWQKTEKINRNLHSDTPPQDLIQPLQKLWSAQKNLIPPVIRVQNALHPWIAFLVMPIFAFANAGVTITSASPTSLESQLVSIGIILALVLGKPVGIMLSCWLAVRLKISLLPIGVSWSGVLIVGLLAGIGFTMSIFIAMLAYQDESLIVAAKIGVLIASSSAAVLGLAWGAFYLRRNKAYNNRF